MAKTKDAQLFAEFPGVSTQQWEEVINADLKGADYEKKLVWKTAEGFSARPYYRAGDLNAIGHLDSKPGEFPYVRGTKACNQWFVRQTIDASDVKAANAKALELLMRGVDSLGFKIGKEITAADMDALLAGIQVEAVELNFTGCGSEKGLGLFVEKMAGEKRDPKQVRASFDIDPITKKLTLKGCETTSYEPLAQLVASRGEYTRIRPVAVNGSVFGNSGSTIVQELAFALSAGNDYIVRLTDAGVSVDDAASSIRFTLSVSSNYFMEIAKFRAARMLWANIVRQYNPSCGCSPKMKIHAVTSMWNTTAYDPYVNMLRGTTEAMSAAIAGVDSLEVTPFDGAFGQPTEFSSRIARNIQLLLKEESHFDQVVDPAGGAYYIEVLTQSIANQAWELFKQVEEKGGYTEAFKAGFIQEQVEASAARKNANVATRREILLGTNQYPNFTETADKAVTETTVVPGGFKGCCDCQPDFKPLVPYRGAMEFEQLRLKTDRSGKTPVAFMLTVGNLAFARARSQFSSNFFACAGIRITDNNLFASVEEGVQAALKAKADIVVICSSDDEYAQLAPEAFRQLGGKAIFVVAGDPACKPELEAAGIRNFISVKSNVLETLKQYQKELGI